jgi:hypothetical protein
MSRNQEKSIEINQKTPQAGKCTFAFNLAK